MNRKLLLIVSLAVNIVLAGSVVFLSTKFSRLPNVLPTTISIRFVTNSPPVTMEKPGAATLPIP
jgi:hypothetical protein